MRWFPKRIYLCSIFVTYKSPKLLIEQTHMVKALNPFLKFFKTGPHKSSSFVYVQLISIWSYYHLRRTTLNCTESLSFVIVTKTYTQLFDFPLMSPQISDYVIETFLLFHRTGAITSFCYTSKLARQNCRTVKPFSINNYYIL